VHGRSGRRVQPDQFRVVANREQRLSNCATTCSTCSAGALQCAGRSPRRRRCFRAPEATDVSTLVIPSPWRSLGAAETTPLLPDGAGAGCGRRCGLRRGRGLRPPACPSSLPRRARVPLRRRARVRPGPPSPPPCSPSAAAPAGGGSRARRELDERRSRMARLHHPACGLAPSDLPGRSADASPAQRGRQRRSAGEQPAPGPDGPAHGRVPLERGRALSDGFWWSRASPRSWPKTIKSACKRSMRIRLPPGDVAAQEHQVMPRLVRESRTARRPTRHARSAAQSIGVRSQPLPGVELGCLSRYGGAR